MGWFLGSTDKKKKKPAASARKTQPTIIEWDPRHTLVALEITGWVVLAGLLAFGWIYGGRALRQFAAHERAAKLKVELHGVPGEWMPPMLMEEITAVVAATIDPNPFAHDTLLETSAELSSNPWVKRVHHVRRKPDGVVQVSADYRTPVALIEWRDGYHLVDEQGVRLPVVYPNLAAIGKIGLPVIRGVKASPAPAGVAWPGGDVLAGLELARLVGGQVWSDEVKAVDVSNFTGRVNRAQPHLALVTREGLVRWGRPPGEEQFYEPDVSTKLENVRMIFRKHKSIDAGGNIVDVHGDVPLINPTAAQTLSASYTPVP